MEEVAKSDYAHYVSEARETEATEHRFEIVNKLLAKLSENERITITLHYLGEMTVKEISRSLGVSVETVKIRLYRARKRLRGEEEVLIQEVLGGVQIPSSLKQNIMQEVIDMKPTPSPKMEPFLRWVAIGTALVVATLLILSFTADFTLTLGTHRSGADLLEALTAEKCRISIWAAQALENPDFPVAAAETPVDIVVVYMRELGFAAGELATLETIYARAKQMGLETCPVALAAQLRLQFLDQPDWTTGRLGSFFVASEPLVLTRDGFPKIFSVVRDDRYPHPETGIGLWLILNGTVDAGDAEHPDRLFNASDPEGLDHGGRFAFVIPK